jgi:exosortase/archaeosortase family protein
MGSEQKGAAFRNGQFLRVALLFCLLATILNLSVWFLAENLRFYNIFTASVITKLMHLSGLQVLRVDNIMYIANNTWKVTTECNALFIMVIFASFIIAYPASLKGKGAALLTGLPFIFGANISRLYAMAWIDKLKPEYSEFFHNYLWQVIFIIMVVVMWMLWIDWINGRENKTAVSH